MSAANGHDLPPGLGAPARRAFAAAGFQQLEQFETVTEAEVLSWHGVGPKAIRILHAAMAEIGLDFAAR